jgi:hypothetical protein
LGGQGRPIDLSEDLSGFDEEGALGRGQLDMVGRSVQQEHAQFTFQPLQLLAQGQLDHVPAGGGPAEV